LGVLEGEELKGTMEKVVGFCTKTGIVEKEPSVGYGAKEAAAEAGLRFDPSYIKEATAKAGS